MFIYVYKYIYIYVNTVKQVYKIIYCEHFSPANFME